MANPADPISEIHRDLTSLGFSEQEAKLYVALVQTGSATAYELAKKAKLAVANTYNIIRSLTERNATIQVSDQPARYVAVEPRELFGAMATRTNALCGELVGRLDALKPEETSEYVEMLSGDSTVERRILGVIESAEEQLLLKAYAPLSPVLLEALAVAAKKNIQILFIYYGDKPVLPEMPKVQLWPHEGNGVPIGADFFIICSDFRRALIYSPDKAEGAYSENRSFVYLAGVFLRHELYLAEIMTRFEPQIETAFGPALYKLRKSYGMLALGEEIMAFVHSRADGKAPA